MKLRNKIGQYTKSKKKYWITGTVALMTVIMLFSYNHTTEIDLTDFMPVVKAQDNTDILLDVLEEATRAKQELKNELYELDREYLELDKKKLKIMKNLEVKIDSYNEAIDAWNIYNK